MRRRGFIIQTGAAMLLGLATGAGRRLMATTAPDTVDGARTAGEYLRPVRIFLCGDVMTGRGIDQIQAHPGDARIYEPYVRSALGYVALAERGGRPLPRAVAPDYIWGDALAAIERSRPDVRIVNLETAVTERGEPWPGKGIQYRMHPGNVACLTAARIDCCVLANNHVLDWGRSGLSDTLATLKAAGLHTAGAGRNQAEACAPAAIDLAAGGRVLVVAFGSPSAGVPAEWAADGHHPGLCLLDETDEDHAQRAVRALRAERRPGDVVVASLHWGGNWGYRVAAAQRSLAHRLIDEAGVDVVHGHSSHHPRPIEVHRGKLILYGCGDFLNDYEGIGGHEAFRPELSCAYLPEVDPRDGRLLRLALLPTRIGRFRVNLATPEERLWLLETFNRECRVYGTRCVEQQDGSLELRWD